MNIPSPRPELSLIPEGTRLKNANRLFKQAPSIFALSPADHVSEKYNFIPTHAVLEVFENMGWEAESAIQQHSRYGGDSELHRKHTVTLSNPDLPRCDNGVGSLRFNCRVTNSHDWGSIFRAVMGVEVKVCDNGLYLPNGMHKHVSIRHDNVLQSVEMITEQFVTGIDAKVIPTIYKMHDRVLTDDEITDFSIQARDLRFTDSVSPVHVLKVRRFQDEGNDLWTIFNVIQENCTKAMKHPEMKRRTRDLTEVSRLEKVNTGLFELALNYLEA
jgi:hypothetical protein